MKIKYNIIQKENVAHVLETYTVREALEELEESGYRCIPILNETKTKFLGNIYTQDIYRAIVQEALTWDDSVMKLKDDENVYIDEQASFFRVFSNIKKYPYLAVLSENGEFSGILTHANVMSILEDSWGIKTGSYTLTISTHEYQGALSTIVSSLKKFTSIQSMLTLDNESTFFRRVIVTLPSKIDKTTLDKIIKHLESEGFRVFDVEKI
ncbi:MULTISPECIES: cyclic di-AMP binding protein CbpA [Bacillaceae]|uniref:Cyclic di-AMP binding protein CbpA n=1 Tax=Evansella alkalicola TaxID=745819 RepID=A0ABS6JZ87_9BACI|nr:MULTISPECIES: cyclic di-AMP binding protein CbpA [Bacillaceae]MBU9723898.1 cyclic di-AMP binding protein CbpA [Bacillus alkalicola]